MQNTITLTTLLYLSSLFHEIKKKTAKDIETSLQNILLSTILVWHKTNMQTTYDSTHIQFWEKLLQIRRR